MTTAKCTACTHEFTIDLELHRVPENEIAKFSDGKGDKTWSFLLVCPKCGHRKYVEIGE